jgi:outer membrane protein
VSSVRRNLLKVLLALGVAPPAIATSMDIFHTEANLPSGPAATATDGVSAESCPQDPLPSPLPLSVAVERSLCESPKTRSAWAGIKAAAAIFGQSKAAYLPTVNASAQYVRQHDSTEVPEAPELRTDFSEGVSSETISFGWVLYDFGARSATLENSRQLLAAAVANQSAVLQSVFAKTAKDYYAAQAAEANLESRRELESIARDDLEAAVERVAKGVAAVTDQLQADTALVQAVYEHAKAEADYETAVGTLAIDMSLSPDAALITPDLEQGVLPDATFVGALHDLMEEAKKTHPSIVAAEAQWQAALAKIRVVRAQGLPTVQWVGEADRSNQPVSASLGQPQLPAVTREGYIGLKVTIPVFEGFERGYLIRQARAEAAEQEQAVRDSQQQVEIGVWSSFETLQVDTQNLRNTQLVVQSAQRAFDAVQHRYRSGVGSILEVLSGQGTLAVARQQRIQAQLDWRTARLQLAASLGKLGMWALK